MKEIQIMKVIAVLVVLFLTVACKSTPDVVYGDVELEVQTKPLVRIYPKYPPHALDKNISGFVKAKFVIKADGSVGAINVTESVPAGVFDKMAIRALKKWKYVPAQINGKPVSSWGETQLDWNHPSLNSNN